jgi:NAD(P)-dependent dehydrogenase (short-subunit alcohol dehydrogenase family)
LDGEIFLTDPDQLFRYDGKRALIVGGATGIGAATARLVGGLGAEVIVLDYADVALPGATTGSIDLRSRASIDQALEQVSGPVHALFMCAGVADPAPGLMEVNFIGQRYFVEALIARDQLPAGAAIAMVASTAGLGWEANLDRLGELLDVHDFDKAVEWSKANLDGLLYTFSKQAVCAYVARQGLEFVKRGIRITSLQPGPTDTPLAQANADTWLASGQEYRAAAGVPVSTPEQQASILAFLCSEAASYLTAITIVADFGRTQGRMLHGFPPAWPYRMVTANADDDGQRR